MTFKYLLASAAVVAITSGGAAVPACAQSSANSAADPSNALLNQRIDTLEAKLNALIDMMSQQHQAASDSASNTQNADNFGKQNAPTDSTASMNLTPGLFLDLYTVSFDKNGPIGQVATAPQGFPVASAKIAAPAVFNWDAFLKIPNMENFSTPIPDKRIGLDWNGYIRIQNEGGHVFQAEIFVDENSFTTACAASLSIDGHDIVTTRSVAPKRDFNTVSRYGSFVIEGSRSAVNQGSVSLEKGIHKFSFWGHCLGKDRDFSKVHFKLLEKGPQNHAPKPIEVDRFFRSSH